MKRLCWLGVLALTAPASAQLWSTPARTLTQEAAQGFKGSGKVYRKGPVKMTFDLVAGRVVGVMIEAPMTHTSDLARGLITAWGADQSNLASLVATFKAADFQASARRGLISPASRDGHEIVAVKLLGSGKAARWQVYTAITVLPESTFPTTKNVVGAANAKSIIHILSDFQCPACQNLWQNTLPAWRKQPKLYRVFYHHYPLSYHKNAFPAALASECAANQGQFWRFADLLFGRSNEWNNLSGPSVTQKFKSYATQLKLSPTAFATCLNSEKTANEVKRQMQAAEPAYLTGTPTVYLNGIKLRAFHLQEEDAVRAITTVNPSAAQVINKRLSEFKK